MFLVFLIILSLEAVYTFPDGAHGKSCLEMVPHHDDANPQTKEPPYVLTVNKLTYSPGDILQVTLQSSTEVKFKGFVIGARRLSGDTENVVGEFIVDKDDEQIKPLSWYSVPPGVPNCITHLTKIEKNKIVAKWKAPEKSVGSLIFSATVVEQYHVYFYNITAPLVKAKVESHEPAYPSAVHIGATNVRAGESCGSKKGCVFYPSHCSGAQCKTTISFEYDKTTKMIDFEVVSKTPGFIALGFSQDKMMGNDQTITCTASEDGNSGINVQSGENPGYFNNRHRIDGITDISISRVDSTIYCRFKRPLSINIYSDGNTNSKPTVYDLNEPHYLFIAHGSLYEGTDAFRKHIELPVITDEKVDFLSTNTYTASALPVLVRLHAVFMVFAWIALAGLGMLTAEFYKERFDHELCKIKVWFHMHRSIMVSVYIFAASGIIVMFVYLKKWSSFATIHGAVGIVTISFATLQIIAGMLRPQLNSPRRKYFNILHRCGGYLTHILSATSIFLVTTISIVPKELKDIVLYTAISWVILDILWNLLHILVKRKLTLSNENEQGSVSVTNKDGQVMLSTSNEAGSIPLSQKRELDKRRLIYFWLFTIFAIMLLVITITLMYFIITY